MTNTKHLIHRTLDIGSGLILSIIIQLTIFPFYGTEEENLMRERVRRLHSHKIQKAGYAHVSHVISFKLAKGSNLIVIINSKSRQNMFGPNFGVRLSLAGSTCLSAETF